MRGFWGEFTDRMRAHARRLGKQNFFIFGEAFDGNDALIGAYTFPGTDADGRFGRFDSVFYFSQNYRVIEHGVQERRSPRATSSACYDSRIGRASTDACCRPTASRRPDLSTTSRTPRPRRRHRAGAAAGAGQLPRQPRHRRGSSSRTPAGRAAGAAQRAVLPVHLGRHPVRVLRHRAAVPRRHRSRATARTCSCGNPRAGYPPFDTDNDRRSSTCRRSSPMRKEHVALRRGNSP